MKERRERERERQRERDRERVREREAESETAVRQTRHNKFDVLTRRQPAVDFIAPACFRQNLGPTELLLAFSRCGAIPRTVCEARTRRTAIGDQAGAVTHVAHIGSVHTTTTVADGRVRDIRQHGTDGLTLLGTIQPCAWTFITLLPRVCHAVAAGRLGAIDWAAGIRFLC